MWGKVGAAPLPGVTRTANSPAASSARWAVAADGAGHKAVVDLDVVTELTVLETAPEPLFHPLGQCAA